MTTSQARLLTALLSLTSAMSVTSQYSAYYKPSASGLPKHSENGQSGTNDCGTGSSPTSMCQNVYLNSITDFCLWAPPNGGEVSVYEATEVSYCTQAGRGTRVIPEGTFKSAVWVQTPHYVQITGTGDFTKIGITANDEGGELDPHGATGVGNPVGGLVFSNGVQLHEWFNFMSATQYCIRACFDGPRATSLCRHTYDELGCDFNAPGNYNEGIFESCEGKDAQDIMYNYPGLSTFQQADTTNGVQVPSAHPAPASSNCVTTPQAALYGATATGFSGTATPTSSSSSSSSTSTSMSSSSTSSNITVVVSTSTASIFSAPTQSPVTSPGSEASSGAIALSGSRSAISAIAGASVAVIAFFAFTL